MRRARVTYKGAWHHVMSRALNGEHIFAGPEVKEYFLRLFSEAVKGQRIRVIAYCLMDTHYHTLVQNTSGRLAACMRLLNGHYAVYYRHKVGGHGYVFQDRYKSTLIQRDSYIQMALIYILLNPVRARLVRSPFAYQWSSIGAYFKGQSSTWLDTRFVERLVHDQDNLGVLLRDWVDRELPVCKTRFGHVLGNRQFVNDIKRRFNRRQGEGESLRMRLRDYTFESVDEVISRFERKCGIRLDDECVCSLTNKRLRAELLVLLRDRAGLRYKEIMKYPLFKSLKYSSLAQLYKRAKARLKDQ